MSKPRLSLIKPPAARPPVAINVKLPGDLHRKVMIVCAVRGLTLGEAIAEAMQAYVTAHAEHVRKAILDA